MEIYYCQDQVWETGTDLVLMKPTEIKWACGSNITRTNNGKGLSDFLVSEKIGNAQKPSQTKL